MRLKREMADQMEDPFIIPGARKSKNWAPVRTSLRVRPPFEFTIRVQDPPPATPRRRVNWDRVLGLAVILVVNGAAWSAVAISISYLLK